MSSVRKGNFSLISSVKANNGTLPVQHYRSDLTGLEIIHLNVPDPGIHVQLVVGTKYDSNSCQAEALKSMIFSGSEDYPAKGFMTHVSKKCFSVPPFAHNQIDHTTYSFNTFGFELFSTILPVFLDNIFFPILSEETYATEVHHVNGQGEDGGKLYLELKEDENIPTACSEARNVFCPEPSGYFYNTRGDVMFLRDSCTVDQVRSYHTTYYHPKNSCLMVYGNFDPNELFKLLEPIERKSVAKDLSPEEWTRPWAGNAEFADEAKEFTVSYPSSRDDELPSVIIRFCGWTLIEDEAETQVLGLLLKYLAANYIVGTSLVRKLAEKDNDRAWTNVCEVGDYPSNFYLEFFEVTKEACDTIPSELRQLLEREAEEFDLQRMKRIIYYCANEATRDFEEVPSYYLLDACVKHFLFSKDLDDSSKFEQLLNSPQIMKGLAEKPKEFWSQKIKSLFLESKWIVVKAFPSKEMFEERERKNAQALKQRSDKYTPENLKSLSLSLERAKIEENKPLPNVVTRKEFSFPRVSTNTSFHRLDERAVSATGVKCAFHFDNIQSAFACITVVIDTSPLNFEDRKYLPLFCDALTKSPLLLEGEELSEENVEDQLATDFSIIKCTLGGTDSSHNLHGFSDPHGSCLFLHCQFDLENMDKAFKWIERLFCNTKFTAKRIEDLNARMVEEGYGRFVRGSSSDKLLKLIYPKGGNLAAINPLLERKTALDFENIQNVTSALLRIRELIMEPSNVLLHVAADWERLKAVHNFKERQLLLPPEWVRMFVYEGKEDCSKFQKNWNTVPLSLSLDPPQQVILGGSGDDKFSLVGCNPSVVEDLGPDLPVILVLNKYLNSDNGPFSPLEARREELGNEYFDLLPELGLLYFSISSCKDIFAGLEARSQIMEHLVLKGEWDWSLVQEVKLSLASRIVQSNAMCWAKESLMAHLRHLPETYSEDLVRKVMHVTKEDISRVAFKWYKDLLNKPCNCVLEVPGNEMETIVQGFKRLGREFTVMKN